MKKIKMDASKSPRTEATSARGTRLMAGPPPFHTRPSMTIKQMYTPGLRLGLGIT